MRQQNPWIAKRSMGDSPDGIDVSSWLVLIALSYGFYNLIDWSASIIGKLFGKMPKHSN